MKQRYLFFFALLFILTNLLEAQECQTIIAEIVMTDPAVSPPDTGYIDVCVGDDITFSASALFPENDLFYHQDVNSCTFQWFFGDGLEAEGQEVSHAYQEPGGYFVYLIVRDQLGCSNTNNLELKIRVAGLPEVTFEPPGDLLFCQGDTVTVDVNYENTSTFHFNSSIGNSDSFPLPDGTGEMYINSVFVHQFEEGQVLSDTNRLESICVTMEHSWMFDLDVRLKCPDGTELILQNQEFISNEVFLGIPFEQDDINTPTPPTPGVGFTYCWTSDASNGTWTEFVQGFNPQTLPEDNYNPYESFDNLLGCPLNGEWQLIVSDQWGSDNGYIFNWNLNFSTPDFEEEPPFSVEVADYEWSIGFSSMILSEAQNSLEAEINDGVDIMYTLTNAWGCTQTFSANTIAVSPIFDACQPCDSIIANAGSDQILGCSSQNVTLNCDGSTSGIFIEHKWYDELGNLIGNNCNQVVDQAGLYVLEVHSEASGCIAKDTVLVLLDEETPIADAGTLAYLSCSVSAVQLGGPNTSVGPNIIYSWTYNGAVFSNDINPIVTNTGIYILEVTDVSNGCTSIDSITVTDELLLDLNINTTSCGLADGSAMASISPAIQNPIVQWSTGESGLQINNLAQGWYSVTITDATCSIQENFFVDQDLSCKVQIKGYVYNDFINQNCIEADAFGGEECVLLHLMPLDIFTYSTPEGYYEFVVDPGSYTVEILPEAYFDLLCPASPSFNIDLPEFGSVSEDHDFYLTYVENSFDLSISTNTEAAIAGFDQMLTLRVCNDGDIPTNATITFTLDSLISDFSTLPSSHQYNAADHTISWTTSNLQPGICRSFIIYLSIPTTIELGEFLDYSAQVTPIDWNINPSNNQIAWSQIVVGAYDPNDKQILTGNNQFGGPIYRQDSVLQYQLRFQNVGTAPAQTVVIRDTLDPAFDVTTIQAGISSHNYVLEFEGHNVLIFRFDGINLPDSTSNEQESHGHVTFSIELKDGLPFGTEIQNNAAIFFDYNAPVITNTVVNILSKPQFVNTNDVHLCEGDEYDGVVYVEDTTLIDTLDFVDYDSVYVTEIAVSPIYDIAIDTTLLADQPYQGVFYENDTILIQNLMSTDGCDSIVTVNIMVEMVDTDDALAKKITLELYPNPAKETLQIRYQLQAPEKVSAYIYDVFGQRVQTVFLDQFQDAEVHQLEIPVADLPSGLYYFAFETYQNQFGKKFLKV